MRFGEGKMALDRTMLTPAQSSIRQQDYPGSWLVQVAVDPKGNPGLCLRPKGNQDAKMRQALHLTITGIAVGRRNGG
jgi:hypothetical protein